MEKISGIYKITNTITGDFYIGSSKDVKRRWESHKWQSTWKQHPNNPMYQDMKRYGTDSFVFQVIEEVEVGSLKEKEQQFIETLNPTYNNYNAKGLNIEKQKEARKKYEKTEKRKKYQKEYQKEYQKSEKYKEYQKEYRKSDKFKKYQKEYEKSDKRKEQKKEYEKTDKRKKYKKEYDKEYKNQLCCYNGEVLTLNALSKRFKRQGIPHPTIEAKKYLLQ